MISLRGSRGPRGELFGFRVELCAGLLGALACGACSEGSGEPPADNAGTSSMSGSGGSGMGNNGGSGPSMGGTSGAGGSGNGGSSGGGSVAASTFYNFDDSVEGFRINYVCTAANVCVAVNPEPAPAGDAGAGDAGTPSQEPDNGLAVVTHDAEVGNPQPGSVQVDINFTAAGQLAVLALNFNTTDFTGRTLSALVTAESGAPAQLVGKMYIKTGETYVYADSGEKLIPAGAWTPFSLNPASPSYTASAMYNPADVREIGIEFSIPMATAFSPAEIHVDAMQF